MYDYVCDVISVNLYLHHMVYGEFLYTKITFMVSSFDHSWRNSWQLCCRVCWKMCHWQFGHDFFPVWRSASTITQHATQYLNQYCLRLLNRPWGCAELATAITWLQPPPNFRMWGYMNAGTCEVLISGIVGAATRIAIAEALFRSFTPGLSNVLMYSGAVHLCLWRCGRHHTTTAT
jgi:hypothetical protein